MRFRKPAAVAILAAALAIGAQSPPITGYIMQTWTALTRSNKNLATAAVDPKFPVGPGGRWPVYVARTENAENVGIATALASVCSTDAAVFTTAENVQVHGGIGFTWEHPAHLYFRRAQSSALLHGSADDARELLLRRLGV